MSQIHKLTLVFTILYLFSSCKSSVPDVISLPKNVENLTGALHKENESYAQAKKDLQKSTNNLSDQLSNLNTQQSTRIEAYSSEIKHWKAQITTNNLVLNNDIDNGYMKEFENLKNTNDEIEGKIVALQGKMTKSRKEFKIKSKDIKVKLDKHAEELKKMEHDHSYRVKTIKIHLKKAYVKHINYESKKIATKKLKENKQAKKLEKSIVKKASKLNIGSEIKKKLKNLKNEMKNMKSKRKIDLLKKLKAHDHSHLEDSILSGEILKENRDLHSAENLTTILERKIKEKVKKYTKQLMHYEKVKGKLKENRKAFANKEDAADIVEYSKEKSGEVAVNLSYNHYQTYLDTCRNHVHGCINYCAASHKFSRTIGSDKSVSYKCGGHDHPLEKCSAHDYLQRVKGNRTCGDACIQEGRCLTYFKNEYNGIYKLCNNVKVQCQTHFCPGEMMPNYLPCMLKCGGNMCSHVFHSSYRIDKYLARNERWVHEVELVIKQDKERPNPIS